MSFYPPYEKIWDLKETKALSKANSGLKELVYFTAVPWVNIRKRREKRGAKFLKYRNESHAKYVESWC